MSVKGRHYVRARITYSFIRTFRVGKGTVRKAILRVTTTIFNIPFQWPLVKNARGSGRGRLLFPHAWRIWSLDRSRWNAGIRRICRQLLWNPIILCPTDTGSRKRCVFRDRSARGKTSKRQSSRWCVYFLTPPDLAELRSRITGRGTDSAEVIDERMRVAREEIEMMALYDYAVVNDEVPKAVQRIREIISVNIFALTEWSEPISKC